MWDRFTIRRKINSFSRKRSWTWAPALPNRAWIVSTNRCNLRCRTCGHSVQPDDQFHWTDMQPEVYERVRRELLPSLQEVYLTGGGEPFIAPIFFKMLDDSLAPYRRVWVTTNGLVLRRDYLERLIQTPAVLRVSLDGTTEEVNRHIRGVGMSRVLEFLEAVREIARRGKHPGFVFEISWVVTKSNLEQMVESIDIAHRYGANSMIFQGFRTVGRIDDFAQEETLIDRPDIVNPWFERACRRAQELGIFVPPLLYSARQIEIPPQCGSPSGSAGLPANPSLANFEPNGRIPQCPLPWWATLIDTDGSVRACCLFPNTEIMGNILEQPFRAIWNGPKYRELRRVVNTAAMPEACRYCTMPIRI